LGAGPPNTDLGASPLNSLNLTKNNCGRVIPQIEVIQRPLVSHAKHVSDNNICCSEAKKLKRDNSTKIGHSKMR
jgi:hypothetical protein